jgi:hypothetical protein
MSFEAVINSQAAKFGGPEESDANKVGKLFGGS